MLSKNAFLDRVEEFSETQKTRENTIIDISAKLENPKFGPKR